MEDIQYTIKDKNELASSCMPFIKGGAIFIKSTQPYHLNDMVKISIQIEGEPVTINFTGKIAWITPKHEQSQLPEGIGVQFPEEEAEKIRQQISDVLPDAFLMLNKNETYW